MMTYDNWLIDLRIHHYYGYPIFGQTNIPIKTGHLPIWGPAIRVSDMVASQKMGQQWAQQIGSSPNWNLLNYVGLGSSTKMRIGLGQLLKKTPDLWVHTWSYIHHFQILTQMLNILVVNSFWCTPAAKNHGACRSCGFMTGLTPTTWPWRLRWCFSGVPIMGISQSNFNKQWEVIDVIVTTSANQHIQYCCYSDLGWNIYYFHLFPWGNHPNILKYQDSPIWNKVILGWFLQGENNRFWGSEGHVGEYSASITILRICGS